MTSNIPQNSETMISQNKVIPISEKTEQPQHHHQQQDLMTPPMSPINTSLSSNQPGTARSSLKITAGQTGLPWLTRDAGGDNNQQTTASPEALTDPTQHPDQGLRSPSSPPPKFLAQPRTGSIIRVPTRKRTMQKHIYSMRDGLDPVKVLCNRLKNWQVSVKYLISMFQNIKKVESNSGKGYRKIDAKFAFPAKVEGQFKSSHGVKDAYAAFRQYTRENSLIHQDFVDFIENEIVPILHVMIKDIHAHMNSLKHNKELRTASLWDCRKKADKIITQLNSDIYATVNSQEKSKSPYVIPKRDPLLTKYVVINTIQDLYKQENRLHKEFLGTQDTYRQFEQEKIINVYTELFRTFENYRVQHKLENLESVAKVATIFSAIETDSEWLDFLKNHENDLVKQTASFKDENTLDFPNISHPLVQPLILGNLQKHHGKKWTEEYYILSPVGLLHRFKNEKEFHHSPLKPVTSMFVPQSTVLVNPTSHLLELKGKALGGGLFGGSKKMFELSSEHPQVIKQWIDILGPMAIQRETAVINTPLPVATDNQSVHSKILSPEDDAAHQQQETSKLGMAAGAGAGAAAAVGASTAAGTDANKDNVAEEQQQEKSMQPIVEGESFTAAPAEVDHSTRVVNEESDDDDLRRQETIEYSTHSPIQEHPPAATTVTDEHNPFVYNKNRSGDTLLSTEPPTTPTNAVHDHNNTTSAKHPYGPTREGSELYWDSNTTPLQTPRIDT